MYELRVVFIVHYIYISTVHVYRVDAIDPALRRSGRFDSEIDVTTPNEEERLQILKVSCFCRVLPVAFTAKDQSYLLDTSSRSG